MLLDGGKNDGGKEDGDNEIEAVSVDIVLLHIQSICCYMDTGEYGDDWALRSLLLLVHTCSVTPRRP